MKNVRILSDDLRKYLEQYEIGYPFDVTDLMAYEDCDDDCEDDYEDSISDPYLNY